MFLKRIAPAIVRGSAEYWKQKTWGQRALLAFLAAIAALVTVAFVSDVITGAVEDYRFNRLSPAAHLNLARAACGTTVGTEIQDCISPSEAKRQLIAIPKSATEWEMASKLLSSIQDQDARIKEAMRANANYAQTQAFEQMQKNSARQAHDNFTCANSTEGKPIMSFDDADWWVDDGRCRARQQKSRDADAETSSYLPSTIRVDTDMDSFWLPDEERTCQSYPDDNGKVSMVACNPTGSHRDHNIPVRFWGGVKRNTVSNWKCRRQKDFLSDEFVCRAIE